MGDELLDPTNPFAEENLLDALDGEGALDEVPTITAPAVRSPVGERPLIVSGEVQRAIDAIMPRNDPLCRADFDVVAYINAQFPTEQSLTGIDDAIATVSHQMQEIDVEIADIVHKQSSASRDGHAALLEAKTAIQELFTRIREIKQKTDTSEMMVKEITRDIKQLDHAKRNLTTSIKTLNHLHMLLAGVDSLASQTRHRQYGDISNLLPGIVNVLEHFRDYMHIPQIRELADQVAVIQRELADQILTDFRDSVAGGKPFAPTRQMLEACRVVSVLEPHVKQELMHWFVKLQLSEYLVLFEDTQDAAWLDKIEQRYAWFIRVLCEVESKYGTVFPLEWDVPQRLSLDFCQITRKELEKIMQKRAFEVDVTLLLHAIQRTNQFEAKLQRRFPVPAMSSDAADAPEGNAVQKNPFQNIISQCFESHLGVYIVAQDNNLNQLLNQFVERFRHEGPPKALTEPGATPLKSSPDLFNFYKKCIVNCQQISSSAKPMVELALVFKKYLREYARRCLTSFLPKVSASSAMNTTGLIQSLLKEGEVAKLSADEQYQVCCILVTAEYCAETTQHLQEKLKEKVGSQYQDQVEMGAEQDVFHQVITTCIHVLVQDVEAACDPALQAMTKKQWSSVESVGDESSYVIAIKTHLKHVMPRLRDYLSQARKYFIQLCMKFANSFISKFTGALYKCKPISVSGAEQLLLDTHSLKTELLNLPSVDSSAQRKAPASFTKMVLKGMTKVEMILKVVMSDDSTPIAFVENFLRLVHDADVHDLQKVMDMRGMRRPEQAQLLELYRQKTSSAAAATSLMPRGEAPAESGDRGAAPGGIGFSPAAPLMSLTGFGDTSGDSRVRKLEKLLKKRL